MALSQYKYNNNLIVELRCVSNHYKDWVHLHFADVVASPRENHLKGVTYPRVIDPKNGKPLRDYSIRSIQYFNDLDNKYIPIDSSLHVCGFIKIPFNLIDNSINKSLKSIDSNYENIYPEMEFLFVRLTFSDSKRDYKINTDSIKRFPNNPDNGLQLFK